MAEPSPKTKEAETQEDQIKRVRQACSLNDFMAHCSWIASSSPELLLCLKANAAGLSPPCQTAIQSLPAVATPAAVETPQAETARPEPAPAKELRANAPTPSGQGAAQKPTPQQKSAVRAACRSDFKSHCSGVQPGGAEALRCLQRNGGAALRGMQECGSGHRQGRSCRVGSDSTSGRTAWADTANASAKNAGNPGAVPCRSGNAMRRYPARRRPHHLVSR